jgi:NAD(P)-dependent dehydrogenase (short-subunit alcohol dehydrogenase family)
MGAMTGDTQNRQPAVPACAIIGVGPGNGAAFARRFSAGGYRCALLARKPDYIASLAAELPGARAFPCDVRAPEQIEATLGTAGRELGPVEVLIYNAGSGAWGNFEDVTVEDFQAAWEINARGLLVAAKHVIPAMLEAGHGVILVVGATASWRGGANFTAFAAAKAAQRSLAQSMARHLGPKGIHVALLIIDGVVDIPRTRAMFPEESDESFLQPDHIAETAYFIAGQQPSAWSFEVDLRPFVEKW